MKSECPVLCVLCGKFQIRSFLTTEIAEFPKTEKWATDAVMSEAESIFTDQTRIFVQNPFCRRC
jgi:hypothetical protein